MGESINKLRNNKGPQIIEVKTHRYREHCGPNFDDELNYRETEFIKKMGNSRYSSFIKAG